MADNEHEDDGEYEDGDDDRVGYGHPPKKHRFKKGQSGNPSGKPKKGARNRSYDEFLEEEKVDVVINGKKKKISRKEAIFLAVSTNVLKGNKDFMKYDLGLQNLSIKKRNLLDAEDDDYDPENAPCPRVTHIRYKIVDARIYKPGDEIPQKKVIYEDGVVEDIETTIRDPNETKK